MAGISVGEGNGKRKSVDSELSLIPMIDLLMVTISFLLITAVWSHMARIDATARAPSTEGTVHDPVPKAELHIDMRGRDRFVVTRKVDGVVISSSDVEKDSARYTALAKALETEWRANGQHRDGRDSERDRVVLHTSNDARYDEIVAAMDAVYSVKRSFGAHPTEAFAVTFAVD
jgi:biopolymer transport protein ExbD